MKKNKYILISTFIALFLISKQSIAQNCNLEGSSKDIISDILKSCENKSKDCYSEIEKDKLKNYPNIIRNDANLQIKLKNGSLKKFVNNELNADSYKKYEFLDYLPNTDYYLIAQFSYESPHYYILLNNNTGKEYTIKDNLIFSPNKKRIFSYSNKHFDTSFGYRISRITKDEVTLEKKSKELLSDANWIDDNNLCLKSDNGKNIKLTLNPYDITGLKEDEVINFMDSLKKTNFNF